MQILKVCTKYTYPKSGTRAGRIYSPEVLKEAFSECFFKEQCDRHFIPVKDSADEFLGYATAKLENGNTVIVEANIWSISPYFEILKEMEDSSVGFILAGYGDVELREDEHIVLKVDFDRALLTTKNSTVDFTTKIYRDDIIDPARPGFAPWITDDFGYNERFRTKLAE